MTTRQDRDERLLDHHILAKDHGSGGPVDAGHAFAGRFNARDDIAVGMGECCHGLYYRMCPVLHKLCCGDVGHNMEPS